jgi:hypothetical protein
MSTSTRFSRPILRLLAASVLIGFVSIAVAGPVGYLQINGKIDVQPAGADKPMRMTENDYAVFSDDRIDTIEGSAVLVLNGGGVIGLSEGSSARVRQAESGGDLTVVLDSGSAVYSVPRNSGSLKFDVDGVIFAAVESTARPADANTRMGDVSGTLSIDENRQVSALARAGDIRVLRPGLQGAAVRGASATAVAYTAPAGAARQSLDAQSFDTLTSVSPGEAVQVQTSGSGGVAAFSKMSGASQQSTLTGIEVSAAPTGTAGAEAPSSRTGDVAMVSSAQGSSWVVIDDEEDDELQSISP